MSEWEDEQQAEANRWLVVAGYLEKAKEALYQTETLPDERRQIYEKVEAARKMAHQGARRVRRIDLSSKTDY